MFNDFKNLVYNASKRKLSILKNIFDRLNLSSLIERCSKLENISLSIDEHLKSLNDEVTKRREENPRWPNPPTTPPVTPPEEPPTPPVTPPPITEPLPPEEYDPGDPQSLYHTFVIFHAHNDAGLELGSIMGGAAKIWIANDTAPEGASPYILSALLRQNHNKRYRVIVGTGTDEERTHYNVMAEWGGQVFNYGTIYFPPYSITHITLNPPLYELPIFWETTNSFSANIPPGGNFSSAGLNGAYGGGNWTDEGDSIGSVQANLSVGTTSSVSVSVSETLGPGFSWPPLYFPPNPTDYGHRFRGYFLNPWINLPVSVQNSGHTWFVAYTRYGYYPDIILYGWNGVVFTFKGRIVSKDVYYSEQSTFSGSVALVTIGGWPIEASAWDDALGPNEYKLEGGLSFIRISSLPYDIHGTGW